MIINDQHYNKIYCNYYFVTSTIDEGSNNNIKYIGLDNIKLMLENLSLDAEEIEKKLTVFQDI